MRVARVVGNGVRRARVVDIGSDIVRVDIDGVGWAAVPGQHAYVHFPTLTLLSAFENHPFSIVPTAMLRTPAPNVGKEATVTGSIDKDVEKTSAHGDSEVLHSGAGVTLFVKFVKRSTGLTYIYIYTKHLKERAGLFTLLDGPYSSGSVSSVLRCERLLLISGGIGVTGVLPWAHNHANAKLFWSVKKSAECLIHSLEAALLNLEKDVRIGERFDVEALVREEVAGGWSKVGVVVCGPGGLCDDVRAVGAAVGREGKVPFELEVEAFSW